MESTGQAYRLRLLTIKPANKMVINMAMPAIKISGLDAEPDRPVIGNMVR